MLLLLNQAKEYYENDKERLQEQARNKYRELSNKEKNIKTEYGRNRCQNISQENKQRLKEYQKNNSKAKKSTKCFYLFLYMIKMEQNTLIFDKHCINKNAFHKNKKPINLDKVEIRRIALSKRFIW